MKLTQPPPRELPPPPSQVGLLDTAAECIHALAQVVTLHQQALWAIIISQLKDGYAVSSTWVCTLLGASSYYLQRAFMFYLLLTAVLLVLVVDLSGCLVMAAATAAAIRRLFLANVPGTVVIPLHFNALPLHNVDWQRHLPRHGALDDFFLPHRETRELIQSMPQPADSLGILQQHMGQFVDAKFSLVSHLITSHLASATMHIPRTAASAEIFSPKGGVNLEGLFRFGPAMFNAKGEYTAKLQVVLAKEEVGRDVSLVLESAMLFSEDAMAVQSVAHLDPLFQLSTSSTVRTGPPYRAWYLLLPEKLLRFWFYPLARSYEYLLSALRQQDSGAPLPPINPSREVDVVLEVYSRFTPPPALQPRLRAMNFTLYQLPDPGAPSRVKVSRMVFVSTVQLTGVARWLTDHPLSTFLLFVAVLFTMFSVVSVGGLLGLLAYVYWRWFRGSLAESFVSGHENDDFYSLPGDMSIAMVKNATAPHLRRHRSSDDYYDSIDISQLRRSQSFNSSPSKKKEVAALSSD
ncbi:hypothetical protein JKF63_03756 [Porcisia hertigi]|uniref:Seipin n=1 Tax=Porcisia hertigi TaxID=2761500 RepID=A0A836I3F6_9TRYP|nr:hypothetical protein JKF63_03756 [Porcisia hertigi]